MSRRINLIKNGDHVSIRREGIRAGQLGTSGQSFSDFDFRVHLIQTRQTLLILKMAKSGIVNLIRRFASIRSFASVNMKISYCKTLYNKKEEQYVLKFCSGI